MERTQVLDLMGTLKLYGMRGAYDEVMATGIKRQHEPPRIVGDLLSAEITEKQARSIKYQLTVAKLPLAKDIEEFDFDGTPVNEVLVRDLANGTFVADQRNAVLIGGTGTGKPHLAIALARARTSIDINELIRDALALVRDELQMHRVSVQAEPNEQLPQVKGDRVQLQQVLLNLITNAINSMALENGARVLCMKSRVHDTGGVTVSVEDTGKVLAPKDIDRIFNPLVTTKSHGMGMGLSICRTIVEAHEGRLWATPNRSRGAVFQFILPADTSMSADLHATSLSTA